MTASHLPAGRIEPRFALVAALAVVACVALWPMEALAEAMLALLALATLVALATRHVALPREGLWLCLALFGGYWLPQLGSAIDAINPARAWREVGVDLRYLPFLLGCAVAATWRPAVVVVGVGLVALAWSLDGLLQAATGLSLGGAADPVRLTGVFGAGNPKLGLVLASLSPFLLLPLGRRFGWPAWMLAALAVGVVVALAGARAAWLSYGLVMLASGWRVLGGRRALLVVLAGGLALSAAGLVVSDRFSERVGRTLAAFGEDGGGIDAALAGRLPIWRAALAMAADHPVNGVGVRGFREAWSDYSDVAPEAQAWGDGVGALHAHHWVLEVLAETGGFGLLCWLAAMAATCLAWRRALPEQRRSAEPAALALGVSLFPLNTHLAVYSTFWGGVILTLAGILVGLLCHRPRDDGAAQRDVPSQGGRAPG